MGSLEGMDSHGLGSMMEPVKCPVIGMLELDTDDTVELQKHEYEQWVLSYKLGREWIDDPDPYNGLSQRQRDVVHAVFSFRTGRPDLGPRRERES